jgi:hypothetical protein
MAWVSGLTEFVRDALPPQKAPNVLAELIARRTRCSRRSRLSQRRWPAGRRGRPPPNGGTGTAGRETADARLQLINDKAIELRGTPHVGTLGKLKTTQPPLARKLYRSGLSVLIGLSSYAVILWSLRNVDLHDFSEDKIPYLIPILIGIVIVTISTWFFVRTFMGRFAALASVIMFATPASW